MYAHVTNATGVMYEEYDCLVWLSSIFMHNSCFGFAVIQGQLFQREEFIPPYFYFDSNFSTWHIQRESFRIAVKSTLQNYVPQVGFNYQSSFSDIVIVCSGCVKLVLCGSCRWLAMPSSIAHWRRSRSTSTSYRTISRRGIIVTTNTASPMTISATRRTEMIAINLGSVAVVVIRTVTARVRSWLLCRHRFRCWHFFCVHWWFFKSLISSSSICLWLKISAIFVLVATLGCNCTTRGFLFHSAH